MDRSIVQALASLGARGPSRRVNVELLAEEPDLRRSQPTESLERLGPAARSCEAGRKCVSPRSARSRGSPPPICFFGRSSLRILLADAGGFPPTQPEPCTRRWPPLRSGSGAVALRRRTGRRPPSAPQSSRARCRRRGGVEKAPLKIERPSLTQHSQTPYSFWLGLSLNNL